MDSFIINGINPDDRGQIIDELSAKWGIGKFAEIVLEPIGGTIGINQVRELSKNLSLMPYGSKFTLAIINNAENLTLEAQQALLKTLEEPPKHAKLILSTGRIATLLPTIISRCEVINIKGNHDASREVNLDDTVNKLKKILGTDKLGERMKTIDEITVNRDSAELFCDSAIIVLETALHQKNNEFNLPVTKISDLLKRLLIGKARIAGYINPKLVMDDIFGQI